MNQFVIVDEEAAKWKINWHTFSSGLEAAASRTEVSPVATMVGEI